MTKEQMAKLPKWAQKEFSTLQKEVESLREFYETHKGEVDGDCSIIVGRYGNTPMKFNPSSSVQMRFSNKTGDYIDFRLSGSFVDVYAGGVLNIKTAAANHIALSIV